jgi:Ca2+-transporting ATPase
VINQIITQHKKNSVLQALALSAITAVILTQDPEEIPGKALILLFNLYQMMIPFSETFLREMINSRLMKKLNADMKAHLIETIDALRIVDLFAALDGYYLERFPQGVAIVSDKTGTLTTAKMDVLGFWTQDMPLNVQQQLLAKGQSPLYSEDKVDLCFDIFADAYTNNKKELEPEEHAILEFFQNKYLAKNLITVDTLGNDHFRKTISTPKKHGTLETWHLGLCRSLGGRFTLVSENGKKYLVFCGVPRAETFRDTPLLQTYSEMQSRTGVLSRDWCLARTELTESMFTTLHDLFVSDNKAEIENLLSHNVSLLSQLQHHATFLIDNPVKKSAENFIQRCQSINVPVFIATGDTVKAADNIAKVLAPASSKKIAVVRPQQDLLNLDGFTADSTVIFAGVNPELLALFDKLMAREAAQRPVIIFAEMSTENKGILAKHLRDKGYFVVANGDGSNDVAMMKNAHMVIAHLTDDGTYAPGVEQLANLNDKQLRELLGSNASFYELFDIDNPNSLFKKKFIHLANSQEKPSIGLMLKSCKISFELAKTVGLVNVEEMWQQHWFSVAFDLIWLGITFYEIMASKDLPFDNKNLTASSFAKYAQLITLTIGIVQSLMTYTLTGESTNISSMVLMISMLPLVLKSIFSAYGYVRDEAYQKSIAVFGQKNLFTQATEIEEMKEDDDMAPPSASELRNRKEVLNFKPL